MTKICAGPCGQQKALILFNRDRRSPDGKQAICRACLAAYDKSRWQRDLLDDDTGRPHASRPTRTYCLRGHAFPPARYQALTRRGWVQRCLICSAWRKRRLRWRRYGLVPDLAAPGSIMGLVARLTWAKRRAVT